MPRRVPVPSLRPALDRCKPSGVSLGKGARVVVAADEGGVAGALAAALEKRGVLVLALDGALPTDEVASRLAAWLKEGPVRGRLLAARARRRARDRRPRPRRVPRGEPPPGQEPPRGHACAVRRRGFGRHLPRLGDPDGRPPRPDAGGRQRAPGRRGGRLHEGLQARAGRGPREGRGLRAGRPGRGGGRRARGRGPGRPRRRRGRPSRRPALDDHSRGAERRGREAGPVADPRHRLRRHRRGRRHHERDRGRPGRRERGDVLPARPGGRAVSRATRRSPCLRQDRETLKLALIEEAKARGREADAGGDRPADPDRRARATRRCARSSRSRRRAARRTGARRTSSTEPPSPGSSTRSGERTAGSTCSSTPGASRSAGSSPRRRPGSSTSSSTSRPTASSAC